MAIYNFDTSIWLDYYEKRGKDGGYALDLILKIVDENSIIIYSDLHIKELKHLGYNIDEINAIFKIVKPNNIRRVHISKEQKEEAKHIAKQKGVPKGDALHAIIAKDNMALMVSKDQDFEKLRHIVGTKKPEELL